MGAFTSFEIQPSYASGFAYRWELHASHQIQESTTFVLESAGNIFGSGAEILVDDLPYDTRTYISDCRQLVPKNDAPYYRVRTADGAAASDWIQPTARIPRRDFLQLREMIRIEYVHLRAKTGVQVLLFEHAKEGSPCTVCRDPVTGSIRNPDCDTCFGSGYNPPFYAPTLSWAKFSTQRSDKKLDSNDKGLSEDQVFQVRLLPQPRLEKNDVLFDIGSGRAYYVDTTQNLTEIRRQPAVVQAVVREIPTNRSVYQLFENAAARYI